MTAPAYSISQFPSKNPHAESPLMLTMIVVPNTSPEQIAANIVANATLPHEWLIFKPETDRPAIMVGGGPSAADHLDDIKRMKEAGGTVFAMNGSSRWLRDHGIVPDWQVIADAKEESSSLVDPEAKGHLFSSAVNPRTMGAVKKPIVWHPLIGGIDECFPDDRKKAEYTIVGGTSAGTHSMCVAYILGHREIHCFGYDSSHRDNRSHAYPQPMNDTIPNVEVEWAGKTYYASVAMKAQAEHFQQTARAMRDLGCKINVHGEGLLPAMWNTPPEKLNERDKYRLMWLIEGYRKYSPGELAVPSIIENLKPEGLILDFGCGTGRASLELSRRGYEVFLIDFADNCRDHEAIFLPFLEWDLTKQIPHKASYGICCDVMEHIPPEDVRSVICNIMASAENVFFQISTVPDAFGAAIGTPLHMSVHAPWWWADLFDDLGFSVQWSEVSPSDVRFVVTATPSDGRKIS